MHSGSSSIKLLTGECPLLAFRPADLSSTSGNSHPELAKAVASRLNLQLTKCKVVKFSDNETSVSIGESVREEDVYILARFPFHLVIAQQS